MNPWVLIGICIAIALGSFTAGEHNANTGWQVKWDNEVIRQSGLKTKADNKIQTDNLTREQEHTQVIVHATQALEQARSDASAANTAADRLRVTVTELSSAPSGCSRSVPRPTGRSKAENPGNLLAVVLDQSIQRNQQLADAAQTAINAGLACEAAYRGNYRQTPH